MVLSKLRREDVPVFAPHFQNLELTSYLRGAGVAFSLEDELAWFESVSRVQERSVTLGVYERGTGRVVGVVDLRDVDHRQGTAELGVCVFDPADWGSGFGSEATRLMVEYGVFHLGLQNVMLRVYAFNTRAIRSYEKVGFRTFGRRSGAVRLGAERFDLVFMEVTADRVDTSALRAQLRLLPPVE